MDARWHGAAAHTSSAREKLLHTLMRDPERLRSVTPTDTEISELSNDVDGRLWALIPACSASARARRTVLAAIRVASEHVRDGDPAGVLIEPRRASTKPSPLRPTPRPATDAAMDPA